MDDRGAAPRPRPDDPVAVFFYGLFMDVDVVRAAGLDPVVLGRGSVTGLALRIGKRAVLVPEAGAETLGVVMLLSRDDLEKLYAGPGLDAYTPQPVFAVLEGAEPLDAVCYNARYEPAERDEGYARRLREAARKAGLSETYIASLE